MQLHGTISPVQQISGEISFLQELEGIINIAAEKKTDAFGKPVKAVSVMWFDNPINKWIIGQGTVTDIEEVIEQTYLLDSEGNYLLDSEGYYLTV